MALFSGGLSKSPASPPIAQASAARSSCTSSAGPDAPPPARPPDGIRGFHSAWYGQTGTMSLCPGDVRMASIFLANTGTRPWVLGSPGNTAYLGTWGPDPGQDQPTLLGGNGARGTPVTGWAEYNRPAVQSARQVVPGQIARFDLNVLAPAQPGAYRLALRPLIEGSEWMEDEGITLDVFALNSDGSSLATPVRNALAPLLVVPVAAAASAATRTAPAAVPVAPLPLAPVATASAPVASVAPAALATARPVVTAVPSVRTVTAGSPQQPPPGATLIANYSQGTGTVVQCADGTWSHSGGKSGACSHHGGTGTSTRSHRGR